ncbi:FAD-binding oxidoreductase [Sulfurospirillum sp. 'SP']|nr:FAD-binding oxidoreductase [Sulfurospirillum sp. 'SP']WNY98477.1 FAD-binding oxidoreductase [Sulfurospirillum sp. 'SP']
MSKITALPKNVSEETMNKAIKEFVKILGADNVLIGAEEMVPYSKIMMAVDIKDHMPSLALQASTKEEVVEIVKVCNKYVIPIWTFSTGKNMGYGTAAPAQRGSVILDLHKMNKIIEVNPDLCYAILEPGVTYQQLFDYIKEKGYKLWLSCPAPSAIASPVGNTMDRGVGYTPYGEHFMMQCGMEIVLADGTSFRTGMGGIENSTSWAVFKWGYGPSLDGIFTQSNYGICTKMGIWLMPEPPVFKPFCITFDKVEDVVDIVESLRPLRIANIIPNAFTIASTLYEAAGVVNRSDYVKGNRSITDEEIEKIKKDTGMGTWNVYAALYGTEEANELNWQIIKATLSKFKNAKFLTEKEMGHDPVFKYRSDLMKGHMTLQEFGLYNWRGGGGSMWFAPVSPAEGKHTLNQQALAKKIMNKYGFDYVAEFIVGWRDMHHIIDLLYDRNDPDQLKKAHDCYAELVHEFAKQGYGVYRTSSGFMDLVAETYGKDIHNVFQKIKRALDPKGILSPGKSGIY